MAHEGRSSEDISNELDIPKGELDFIVRINRDGLMFSDEDLPEWAKQEPSAEQPSEMMELKTLGDRFRNIRAESSSSQAPVTNPVRAESAFARVSLEPIQATRISPVPEPRFIEDLSSQVVDETLPNMIQKITETKVFQKALKVLDAERTPSFPVSAANGLKSAAAEVRPFVFRKISATDNLG
jgi:hypothetical protein